MPSNANQFKRQLFLGLLFLMFFSSGGRAQNPISGLNVQYGASTIVNPDPFNILSPNPKFSLAIGVFNYAKLTDRLFLKSGFNIATKGVNGKERYFRPGVGISTDDHRLNYYYAEVPIELSYHRSYRLTYFGGIYYAYMVWFTEKFNDVELSASDKAIHKHDVGPSAGLLYRLNDLVKVGARLQYGLINTRDALYSIGTPSSPSYIINHFYGKNLSGRLFIEIDFERAKN